MGQGAERSAPEALIRCRTAQPRFGGFFYLKGESWQNRPLLQVQLS